MAVHVCRFSYKPVRYCQRPPQACGYPRCKIEVNHARRQHQRDLLKRAAEAANRYDGLGV